MKRRDFIGLLGGAIVPAVWPQGSRAQQAEPVRRIGALINLAADHPESPARIAAFAQGLAEHGWTIGRNVRIDYRWAGGNPELFRRYAGELVAMKPDVILAAGTGSVAALRDATGDIPVVFTNVSDPVGQGFVESLDHPGGNVSGFMLFEFSLTGKWLELLRQIVPSVSRVAVVRSSTDPAGIGQFGAIQTVATSLGLQVTPIDVRDAGEIERAIAAFGRIPNGGLVITGAASITGYRNLIIALAAKYKIPAVYPNRLSVLDGGLACYGPDAVDTFRRAAGYVDRVLKGEKPAELPVQAPTKYELVINRRVANALGLAIPEKLLATADEVIE
jgi:putative tryptophan/tyrosine transport system substrate-binding protein